MSKQAPSRPTGDGTRPKSANAKAPAKPVTGTQKSTRPAASTPISAPKPAPAPSTAPSSLKSGASRPGVAPSKPAGMTAQQRIQAQQAAARQKSGGGFKIRPLDVVLLLVGVIVVGLVVWSVMSGSNQARLGLDNQPGSPGGGPNASSTPLPVGVAAPNFTLPGADGNNYSLSDYKGKVVLLEFFAPWCPHCQADAPIFNAVADKYKGKDVQVLALSASPYGKDYGPNNQTPISMDDIKWFQNEYKVTFPMLLDKDLAVAEPYSIMFYPTVYLVDKAGNIAAQPAGFFTWENGEPKSRRDQPLNEETLSAEIDKLLK